MNLNTVSVFVYHESLRAQHLLDFLRRCEALGLHVNQSLRPGTPMDFQWQKMKELIEFFRLAQNDTVFAYDLAWEPSHDGYAQQQSAYAQLWTDWVLKRYGTVAAAERVWGSPIPHSALRTWMFHRWRSSRAMASGANSSPITASSSMTSCVRSIPPRENS